MAKTEDLTGKKFGRLIVLKKSDKKDKGCNTYWECSCECGNKTIVKHSRLTKGTTKSCGCLAKELTRMRNHKEIVYDLSGEYGIGYTVKGEPFYFDLEDYDLIKDYCWYKDHKGYICTSRAFGRKTIRMHRLIMGVINIPKIQVDHIHHNKHDNRKNQLRLCSNAENQRNVKIHKNNTSGVGGVFFRNGRWRARIGFDYKRIYLGSFDTFEDAVAARKKAEEEHYGEFSYDNSMKIS